MIQKNIKRNYKFKSFTGLIIITYIYFNFYLHGTFYLNFYVYFES